MRNEYSSRPHKMRRFILSRDLSGCSALDVFTIHKVLLSSKILVKPERERVGFGGSDDDTHFAILASFLLRLYVQDM